MEPLSSGKGSLVGMPYPILLGVDKRAQSSSLKPGMSRDWLLVCHCAINAFLVTSRLLRRCERSLRPFCSTAKAPGIWVHPKVDSGHFWFLRHWWEQNHLHLGVPHGGFCSKICSCDKKVSMPVWLQHAASACQKSMHLRVNSLLL